MHLVGVTSSPAVEYKIHTSWALQTSQIKTLENNKTLVFSWELKLYALEKGTTVLEKLLSISHDLIGGKSSHPHRSIQKNNETSEDLSGRVSGFRPSDMIYSMENVLFFIMI